MPKRQVASQRRMIRALRKRDRHKLELICRSFSCGAVEKESILKSLKIKNLEWLKHWRSQDIIKREAELGSTYEGFLDLMKKKQYDLLAKWLEDWAKDRRIVTLGRLRLEAVRLIRIRQLEWVNVPGDRWFQTKILAKINQPMRKFRRVYEWVEDELEDKEKVSLEDFQMTCKALLSSDYCSSKTRMSKLRVRVRKFFKLRCQERNGSQKTWMKV